MDIKVTASRPATHRTAVVFAGDGLYARFAMLAASDLRRISKDAFDICLCTLDTPDPVPPTLGHLDVRQVQIDPGDLFSGLRLDKGHTQIPYLRLALPEAFSGDYDRILYLDSDILIERGDFAVLLGVDLQGRALAAVRDNMQWRTPRRRPAQFKRLGLPRAPYFNSGVLLMDVARWNAEEITRRAIDIGTRNRDRMIRHDQNLLNAVLQGDWAELNPVWNWQYTRASNFFAEMMDPNILHFISPAKPWKKPRGRFPPSFRERYARFLEVHFPGEELARDPGPRPQDNPAYMRSSLWKHLLSTGRFTDYLRRFDHELSVLDPRER